MYLPAEKLVSSGFQITVTLETDIDGSLYYHAEKTGDDLTSSGGQHIRLRETYKHPNGSGSNAGGGSKLSEPLKIGTAHYIVIKLRSNMSSVYFNFSSTGWNVEDAISENPDANSWTSVATGHGFYSEEYGWTTFVLDMNMFGKFFQMKDGEYVIDTFCLMQGTFPKRGHLDIKYIAFVDSVENAKVICDTEQFISIDAEDNRTVIDID